MNKLYSSPEIAASLNLGINDFHDNLTSLKVQYRTDCEYVLNGEYSNCGYVEYILIVLDNGNVIYDRKWTQIGREFIVNLVSNLEFSGVANHININGVV